MILLKSLRSSASYSLRLIASPRGDQLNSHSHSQLINPIAVREKTNQKDPSGKKNVFADVDFRGDVDADE